VLARLRSELPMCTGDFKNKFNELTGCEFEFDTLSKAFVIKELNNVYTLRTPKTINYIDCDEKTYTAILENVLEVYNANTETYYLISYKIKAVRLSD
jgi:hypothetical protein